MSIFELVTLSSVQYKNTKRHFLCKKTGFSGLPKITEATTKNFNQNVPKFTCPKLIWGIFKKLLDNLMTRNTACQNQARYFLFRSILSNKTELCLTLSYLVLNKREIISIYFMFFEANCYSFSHSIKGSCVNPSIAQLVERRTVE